MIIGVGECIGLLETQDRIKAVKENTKNKKNNTLNCNPDIWVDIQHLLTE